MNSYFLTIEINANIIYYIIYYIYLLIFKKKINAFTRKVFNTKNFFFYNKIVKNINCEIIT